MASRILRLSNNLRGISRRFKSTHSDDYRALVSNLPQTDVTALDNGVRVASEDNGSSTVSIGLWIDSGSRHEDANNNGVGNLLEKLLLKGTASRTQTALEEEIANLGARVDAWTSREQTAVVAQCLPQHVPKVVEILSDAIQNPKLDDAQIERARKSILRELDDISDNDQKALVLENLHTSAYQGTPLGQPITGLEANIKSLSKVDLENHIANHLKGSRIVLSAAGSVNHKELVDLANKHLGKLEDTFDKQSPILAPCRFTSSDVRVRDDSIPLAYVAVAFEGPGLKNDDYLPLEVARHYLGSWDRCQASGANHPLTLAKHCDQGWEKSDDHNELKPHSYEAINIAYKDTALWGTLWVCEPMSCENMLHNVATEYMRICNILSNTEVKRAKNTLKANLLRSLNNNNAIANEIGSQVLVHGRRIPFVELEEKINSITADKVRNVVSHYVYDRSPTISAVGQIENLLDLTRTELNFTWIRT